MSSDTDSMCHITVLLETVIAFQSIIWYILMAAGSNNISQMARGSLFLTIKYKTLKEVRSTFVQVVTAALVSLTLYRFQEVFFQRTVMVYSQRIHVL
jgi:hypothetical protein